MTLNQASRQLDAQMLDAVNHSGLPLRVIELQLLNLLHIVQEHLAKEEASEQQKEDEADGRHTEPVQIQPDR